MKKFVAVFCLLLCAASLQAKPNPADFDIKVHISATQIEFLHMTSVLFADAVLNGKKVKLAGFLPGTHPFGSPWAFAINPGDYQIRLKKDQSEKDGSIIRQVYELLLPNGEIWECSIAGISE